MWKCSRCGALYGRAHPYCTPCDAQIEAAIQAEHVAYLDAYAKTPRRFCVVGGCDGEPETDEHWCAYHSELMDTYWKSGIMHGRAHWLIIPVTSRGYRGGGGASFDGFNLLSDTIVNEGAVRLRVTPTVRQWMLEEMVDKKTHMVDVAYKAGHSTTATRKLLEKSAPQELERRRQERAQTLHQRSKWGAIWDLLEGQQEITITVPEQEDRQKYVARLRSMMMSNKRTNQWRWKITTDGAIAMIRRGEKWSMVGEG